MVLETKNSVIGFFICAALCISCGKGGKDASVVSVDTKSIPAVHTENIRTLISDSGITRYNLQAKVWDIFSHVDDPYWYFPEGVYAERFDSLFQVEGNIKADTAYYFVKKELWRLIGNVFVKNMEGRTFETTELFWNQRASANATDAFSTREPVKITEPDGTVIDGRQGFKSNQSLSYLVLYSSGGELYFTESDSIKNDSIQ